MFLKYDNYNLLVAIYDILKGVRTYYNYRVPVLLKIRFFEEISCLFVNNWLRGVYCFCS